MHRQNTKVWLTAALVIAAASLPAAAQAKSTVRGPASVHRRRPCATRWSPVRCRAAVRPHRPDAKFASARQRRPCATRWSPVRCQTAVKQHRPSARVASARQRRPCATRWSPVRCQTAVKQHRPGAKSLLPANGDRVRHAGPRCGPGRRSSNIGRAQSSPLPANGDRVRHAGPRCGARRRSGHIGRAQSSLLPANGDRVRHAGPRCGAGRRCYGPGGSQLVSVRLPLPRMLTGGSSVVIERARL